MTSNPLPEAVAGLKGWPRPRSWLSLLALLGLAAALSSAGCKRRPALDQQARELLTKVERAAEEGDLDGLRALLSPKFKGPDDLERGPALLLLRARLRARPVHILSRVTSLEVMPGGAARGGRGGHRACRRAHRRARPAGGDGG